MPIPLTTFGEWIEANAVAIIGSILGWILSAAGILWYVSQAVSYSKANGEKLKELAKAFEDHADDFDKHKSDASIHTTFEFRQHVQSKFDRIEDEIKTGHERIENKIDRWAERIMLK